MKQLVLVGVFFLLLLCTAQYGKADYLPNSTVETQQLRVYTVIDTVGVVMEKTTMSWDVSTGGLNDGLMYGERYGSATVSDSIMTNGGRFRETRTLDLSTAMQSAAVPNLDQTRVITYESEGGSHMFMDEAISIALSGSVSSSEEAALTCVFSTPRSNGVPAFSNRASAKSSLRSVTSAAITTSSSARITGTDASVPAALAYEISVMPTSESETGYANAMISTLFTTSVKEGRETDINSDLWDQVALDMEFSSAAAASGYITTFAKSFVYNSGLKLSSS
ncbi:MAG: hypothetical protein LBV40_01980 [Methanomicrobiales archaeon]|jgi:hypothetical protein|nr:hypothetical protein [Methanomicrobiales archaeon]